MVSQAQEIKFTRPATWMAASETLLVTLLIPVIGLLANSKDPLFLHSPFPWLMFAPLLAGARYGFFYGFSSALGCILLTAAEWHYLIPGGAGFPYQASLGFVLSGMLAGEFTDTWLRRLGRMQAVSDYQSTRLNEFTRSYHLLKTSHDRLEERLAGQRHSLRDALLDMRKKFYAMESGGDVLSRLSPQILEFLSVHAMIQASSLYEVSTDGRLSPEPLAKFGQVEGEENITADHPMIRACLDSRNLISLRTSGLNQLELQQRQRVLAVVPLIDVNERIWAVVAVKEMPFVVFHQTNLSLLAILGGAIGDVLSETYELRGYPEQPASRVFVGHLSRWVEYTRRYRIASMLVGIEVPDLSTGGTEVPAHELIFEQFRALDEGIVMPRHGGGKSILVLMPLTGEAGASAQRQRLEALIARSINKDPTESGLVFHQHALNKDDEAKKVYYKMCEVCQVETAD